LAFVAAVCDRRTALIERRYSELAHYHTVRLKLSHRVIARLKNVFPPALALQ